MLGAGLVVPGLQPLDEGQQLLAQQDAQQVSPVAVAERVASRTRYSGLTDAGAAKLAVELFPRLDRSAGGLVSLGPIGRITGYPSSNAASVLLADGKHGVIESLVPIAVKNATGQHVPIDLGLSTTAEGFEPVRPLVNLRIPSRLAAGVQIGRTGVSLVPISATGGPLGGHEAVVDGAGAFYANTQTDVDTLIEPATLGFEASTILRSARSPRQLRYRIVMPRGGQIIQDAAGAVDVLIHGKPRVTILPPHATDAVGVDVPVSMKVLGNILTLKVQTTQAHYPILVDPYAIEDKDMAAEGSTWAFVHYPLSGCPYFTSWTETSGTNQLGIRQCKAFKSNEQASLNYSTQGESRIYEVTGEFSGDMYGYLVESTVHIMSSAKEFEAGSEVTWVGSDYNSPERIFGACVKGSCPELDERGTANNSFDYGLATTGEGSSCCVFISMSNAVVHIAQEKGPEMSAATTSEVDGKHNVLAGSGSWLGPHSGSAFEIKSHDPGIGLSGYALETSGGAWHEKENFKEGTRCGGVECEPTYDPVYEYVAGMPNGEHDLLGKAEDAMGLKAEITASSNVVLKVDSVAPTLTVKGLKTGSEIGEGEYAVTAEATDGTAETKSSGVKSVTLTVSGREVGSSLGSCPAGPCTVKGEWTINGAEFGAGEHQVTVTATDNVGNVEQSTFTIKVHHDSPTAIGPGSVNPQSGEFSMTATDVSITTPGGELLVGRSYGSRHLKAGGEGPLGPQWSLSVGDQESITRGPYVATLTTAAGGEVTFTGKAKEFTAPPGDANLTLTEEENVDGEPTEYILKNAADGAATHFTLSNGKKTFCSGSRRARKARSLPRRPATFIRR